ncbi:PadR family transcriptional regulator [Corynebacterium nasicanis]|uniref:PadR family transcriptional regulator n=1 Tax=Corynebacterium nasicanis TaxID=1448267 RepID=A0ABW1Q9U8_9CORY
MAFVILGLLHLRAMSMYDLVKAFDQGISLFYSASTGSIKRALDGLLAKGHIAIDEIQPGARGRKTYAITEAGRSAFQTWMHAPLTETDIEAAALPRLYLLGLLPAAERPAILSAMRERVARDLATLENLATAVDATPVAPELADVAHFGRATLDYGITSHRAGLEWFSALLDSEGTG